MSKRKIFSIKQQYKESFNYLKESLIQIIIIATIFITSIFLGFFSANLLSQIISPLLRQIINQTIDLDTTELIFFILQNNLQTSFFGFISGIFLGIFPILTTLINGVVIGYVIERATQLSSFLEIINTFIPHGIFEIPAVIISLALGLKFTGFILAKPGHKIKELKRRFYNSINIFLFIILPLLIIAAIIEGLLIYLI